MDFSISASTESSSSSRELTIFFTSLYRSSTKLAKAMLKEKTRKEHKRSQRTLEAR